MALWEKQREYLGVWVGVWGVLYLLIDCWVVALLTAGCLGLVLADLLLKSYEVFLAKRENISDTSKKAVLITGCDTGFGNKLSERLSELGFKVFAGCLKAGSAGAMVLAGNPRIRVVQMDVTKQEEVDQVYQTIKEDISKNNLKLWSIVNNAGIAMSGEVEFLTVDLYRQVLNVNTIGPMMVTKTFLPLLRAGGEGRVVNVASQAGRFTMFGFTAYSMSKHALVAFSDGLRLEMKKWNISVHTVEPALYTTPITDQDNARSRINKLWETADDEVKTAYGKDYFDTYLENSLKNIRNARPADKVYEVIDDLVDAVAGVQPQIRYIPCTYTKAWQRVLRTLPFEIGDAFWLRLHPSRFAPISSRQ